MIPVPSYVFSIIDQLMSVGSIPVVDCFRCKNPLSYQEMQTKEHHCAPCKKIVEAHEHSELLGKQIARANRVSR